MDQNKRLGLKLLAGGVSLLASACGGAQSSRPSISISPPPPPPPTAFVPADGILKKSFENKFLVGAAISPAQIIDGSADAQILRSQFNSITAENLMKPNALAPTKGNYTFEEADKLLAFAEANNIKLRGHSLLWHRATPDYFFEGSPAEVRQTLEDYVTAVVTHFKGKVYAWDVVNEVVSDTNGATAPYRDSNWYRAAGGPNYIDWAFEAARKADPDAFLFINDYSTEQSEKRNRLLTVITDLQSRNIPIDGVGHQLHIQASTPASDVFAAIDAIDNQFMGLQNHVTELDISIYNDPGSCFSNQTGCAQDYGNAIPQSVLDDQARKYKILYEGFAARMSVTSVTVWGVSDAQSWLNYYPVDRINAPLLFDRDRQAKKGFRAITEPGFEI